jgi:hypothetical protein
MGRIVNGREDPIEAVALSNVGRGVDDYAPGSR